jgi:hypothetical protein
MIKNPNRRKRALMIANVVVLLGFIGATGYLYMKNKDLRYELSLSEQDRVKIKNDELLAKVSKLMNLPNEEPVIVLVNDPAKAEEENPGIKAIFDNLQKDDFLLIFKKAKLGVQYRPSELKIIKSTTINLPITLEIVGTQTAIDATIKSLEQLGNQISVIQTVNTTITDSAIYDVDNNQPTEVQSLDALLKIGATNTLPNTVTANSQAEIVILAASSSPAAASTEPAQP